MYRRIAISGVVAIVCLFAGCKDSVPPESEQDRIVRLISSADDAELRQGQELFFSISSVDERVSVICQLLQSESAHAQKVGIIEIMFEVRSDEGLTDEQIARLVPELLSFLDGEQIVGSITLADMGPPAVAAVEALEHEFDTAQEEDARWAAAIAKDIIVPGSMEQEVFAALMDSEINLHIVCMLHPYGRVDDVEKKRRLAGVLLDVLVMEVASGADDFDTEMTISDVEFALWSLLRYEPSLLGIYEDSFGRGIDDRINSIIAEAESERAKDAESEE